MIPQWSDALGALLMRIDVRYLAPLVLVVLWHFLAEPARWRCYLIGNRESGMRPFLQIFSLAALVTLTMPVKLGLPVRLVLLHRRFVLPWSAVSGLLAMDGMIYYAAWAIAAAVGLPWAVGLDPAAGPLLGLAIVSLVAAAVIGLAGIRRLRGAGRFAGSWLARTVQRVAAGIEALHTAVQPRVLATVVAINALDIGGHVLRHGILLALIGHNLPWLNLWAVTCLSIFAGLASMMPMGLGGYDIALIFLLSQQGIPAPDGIAVALANRVANLLVSLPLGIWAGAGLGVSAFNQRSLQGLLGRD